MVGAASVTVTKPHFRMTVLLTVAELPPAASVTFSSKRDLMSVDRAIFILVNHLQVPVDKECNEQHRQSGIE